MGKLKIFYFTTDSKIGGTERMVLALLKGLNREAFEPFLCFIKPGGSLQDEAGKLAVRTACLGIESKADPAVFFRLASLLRKERPKILHTFLFHANILGRAAGRLSGVPVIISSQRSVDKWRKPWHSFLDSATSGMCDLIISNSEAGREALIEREKIKPAKIITIHNGIDLSGFSDASGAAEKRAEFGFKPADTVLGIVANLREVKGHKYLFEAFHNAKRETRNSKLKLLVVGEGKLKQELVDLAEKLGIKNDITFTGFRDDIPGIMNAIDIFVLPSLWEGFPVSILEAMACGKPVIASRVGGIPEAVEDGVTGILVPPADAPALGRAITALAGSTDKMNEMGNLGRAAVGARFSIDKMISSTEGVYDRISGNRG